MRFTGRSTMNREYVLFDFDGTVSDTSEGIINSAIYALEKFGITCEDRRALCRFIGPPLYDSFVEFYGFSDEMSRAAVGFFRERYNTVGIYESRMYDGIDVLLHKLKDCGRHIMIVSSKAEECIKELLRLYNIADCFEFVAGASDAVGRTKEDVMRYAVDVGGADVSKAVMVGDTKYDIKAARLFGIKSVGVTYGFGTVRELEDAGADYIADSVAETEKIILKL